MNEPLLFIDPGITDISKLGLIQIPDFIGVTHFKSN